MKELDRNALNEAGKRAAAAAREQAFEAGTFISFGRDGKVLREYPDGRIVEVVRDESGELQEVEYTRR